MIYNSNSLQRLFITGRFTLTFLLAGAFLLWVASWLWDNTEVWNYSLPLPFVLPVWLERVVSFALYMGVALILNSFIIIEGRTPWLGGIMVWFTGLFISLQSDMAVPLSLLMSIVTLSILFSCHGSNGVERRIFVAFMSLGVCSLLFPQFAYMPPLFFLYLAMISVMSARGVMAAFLGAITPYWLYLGTTLVFSLYDTAWSHIVAGWNHISAIDFIDFSISETALYVLEIVIMIISTILFAEGYNPTKPLMRKTLKFFMLMNLYLLIIAVFKAQDNDMLMAWRLPGLAVMSAYIYSYKVTKLFNIYFVVLNIWWLMVAILKLWNG